MRVTIHFDGLAPYLIPLKAFYQKRPRLVQLGGAVIGLYLALLIYVVVTQRDHIYQPTHLALAPTHLGLPDMTEITSEGADRQKVISWFAPPQRVDAPVFVMFHGSGGWLGTRADKARKLLDAGYGLVMLGYRGYGPNTGQPSETGLYIDAMGLIDYLTNLGISPAAMVLYGESLGTGVAIETAKNLATLGKPVRAVVLEAPYTRMADLFWEAAPLLPYGWLLDDRFDNAAKIQKINAPVLIVHGTDDDVVPFSQGQALYEMANPPKRFVRLDGFGHSGLFDAGLAAVQGFLSGSTTAVAP